MLSIWYYGHTRIYNFTKKLISSSVMKYLSGPSESMLEYKR